MIKSLLESNEIPAELFGEYLQGGIGELQAIGAVRVMVADQFAKAAANLIQEWESHEPVSDPNYELNKSTDAGGFSFWSFCAGFVLACVMCVVILT